MPHLQDGTEMNGPTQGDLWDGKSCPITRMELEWMDQSKVIYGMELQGNLRKDIELEWMD